MISVIVLTHNRLALLRRCVQDVLLRTSEKTREIIIWDNASEDGTSLYLEMLDDPRIRVVTHPKNIGTNAYARAFALATQDYLVELDDDVIEAPHRWDEQMLEAFGRIPNIGYLAASLVDDPNDSAARYVRYLHQDRRAYVRRQVGGITILEGPTGGGCTMTSRELYDRIGGFRQSDKLVFWHEDAAYVRDVHRLGYRSAVLETVKVWHAGSPYYSEASPAKIEFHRRQDRINARKDAVKRLLLRVPLVDALNGRFNWFEPPHSYVAPRFDNNDQGIRSDAEFGASTETRREE